MSALPSTPAGPPQTGPPMGLIIGGVVVVIIIVIIVVLWQTGAFGGGGVGASPSPSVSQNATNIKTYYDAVLHVSCPDFSTAISTWADSVGVKAVATGQACPTGTVSAPTMNSSNTGGFQLCITPGVSQNPPSNIVSLYSTCLATANSSPAAMMKNNVKNNKNVAAQCLCPTGYYYAAGQPVNQRCLSTTSSAVPTQESCSCPNGYTYNPTGFISHRCEPGMVQTTVSMPVAMAAPAPNMAPVTSPAPAM